MARAYSSLIAFPRARLAVAVLLAVLLTAPPPGSQARHLAGSPAAPPSPLTPEQRGGNSRPAIQVMPQEADRHKRAYSPAELLVDQHLQQHATFNVSRAKRGSMHPVQAVTRDSVSVKMHTELPALLTLRPTHLAPAAWQCTNATDYLRICNIGNSIVWNGELVVLHTGE